jgi:hypothetical protein
MATGGMGTGGVTGGGGGGALCPDLDTNGQSDCTQSLVANPNFATDISQWTLQPTLTAEWVAAGAQGASTGAIYVNFTSNEALALVLRGPEQCVPASPRNYKIFAEAFIASADNPPADSGVQISVLFFNGAGCTGSLVGSTASSKVTARDVWSLLQGGGTAPAGTASMKVRLGLIKPGAQSTFKATIDNVLVAPDP